MRITPLDMRQQRFRTAMRGYDRAEVVAFLTEAADDYEQALREIDRLRARPGRAWRRCSSSTASARATCATRCSPRSGSPTRSRNAAQNEAQADRPRGPGPRRLLLQKAQARLEEVERDINELRLRRRDAEGSLEATIQALYRALEFIRDQDEARDDKVLLHRPRRPSAAGAAPAMPLLDDVARSAERPVGARPRRPRHPACRARTPASPACAATPCSSGSPRRPVDGAANDALVASWPRSSRVPRRDVAIAAGEQSRDKVVADRRSASLEAAFRPALSRYTAAVIARVAHACRCSSSATAAS